MGLPFCLPWPAATVIHARAPFWVLGEGRSARPRSLRWGPEKSPSHSQDPREGRWQSPRLLWGDPCSQPPPHRPLPGSPRAHAQLPHCGCQQAVGGRLGPGVGRALRLSVQSGTQLRGEPQHCQWWLLAGVNLCLEFHPCGPGRKPVWLRL